MKGMGEEKISDVAGIDGDELREVVCGAVPVIFCAVVCAVFCAIRPSRGERRGT